jgi:hypothetical protein
MRVHPTQVLHVPVELHLNQSAHQSKYVHIMHVYPTQVLHVPVELELNQLAHQ